MVRTHWIPNNNMAVMADSPTDFPLEEEDLHLNFIFDSFIFLIVIIIIVAYY